MESHDDRPESLPEQVVRLGNATRRYVMRTRASWAPLAWYAACFLPTVLVAPWIELFLTSEPRTATRLIWRAVHPPVAGFAFGATTVLPVLAALLPLRLVPRFIAGLIARAVPIAITPYAWIWCQSESWATTYSLVFVVVTVARARWGVSLRRRGTSASPFSTSVADLLVLTTILAIGMGALQVFDQAVAVYPTAQRLISATLTIGALASLVLVDVLELAAYAPALWVVFASRTADKWLWRMRLFAATALMFLVCFALTFGLNWSLLLVSWPIWGLIANQAFGIAIGSVLAAMLLAWALRWSGYCLVWGRPESRPVAPDQVSTG